MVGDERYLDCASIREQDEIGMHASKDRVTTAMGNSGYRWARGRTTINLTLRM